MTTYECTEMPTCNLVEMVHNKWLQQSGNKMTCMYEAMIDYLINAFMQVANYTSWLNKGCNGKGPNFTSLKLKVATRSGDPNILKDATEIFLGAEDLNTRDCALDCSKLLGPPNES